MDLSGWDAFSATGLSYALSNCSPLTFLDLSGFRFPATGFRFPTGLKELRLEGSDTSQVTSMAHMFRDCSSLASLDLSGWDVSQVTDMSYMFRGCSSLASLGLSGWDALKVSNVREMFEGCSSLISMDLTAFHFPVKGFCLPVALKELRLDGSDTSQVIDMSLMFNNCSQLTSLDLSDWDTSQVADASGMFAGCSSLTTLNLSGWDTSQMVSATSIFSHCTALVSLDLSGWDTSSMTAMDGMFSNCSSLVSLDLSSWDTSSATRMGVIFNGCSSLTSLNLSSWDASSVTDGCREMLSGCSSLVLLDMSGFRFPACGLYFPASLEELHLEESDTSRVTDMSQTFYGCSSLVSLDLSDWETSQVTTAAHMFFDCSSLVSLDLSGWDLSSADVSSMFSGCSALASLNLSGFRFPIRDFYLPDGLEELHLEGSDTSSVVDMAFMFFDCSRLTSLDLSDWDTSMVISASGIFGNCSELVKIALGEHFTLASELPVPSEDFIPGATGLWYGPDGTGYRPADIPVGVAATYTALPPAAAAPSAQPASLGEAPDPGIALSLYPGGLLEVRPSGSAPSAPGEPVASWELPADARFASAADAPWAEHASQVLEVRVLDGVRPPSCAFWFAGMADCVKFDLAGLDTSACSDFAGMFEGCDPAAEVVLGPLFSVEGDGACAPCELPGEPDAGVATDEPNAGEADVSSEESDGLDADSVDEGDDNPEPNDGLEVLNPPAEETPITSEDDASDAGVTDAVEPEAPVTPEDGEATAPEDFILDEGMTPDSSDSVISEPADCPDQAAIEEASHPEFSTSEHDISAELPIVEEAASMADSELPLAA